MKIELVQDEDEYVYVHCGVCEETLTEVTLVPIGPIQQAFDLMREHNTEVHP